MKKARKEGNKIHLRFNGKDFDTVKNAISVLPQQDRYWNSFAKEWEINYKEEYYKILQDLGFDMDNTLYVSHLDMSWKRTKLPCKYDFLKNYQRDSLKYLLHHDGRGLLALDQGLGKTLTAMAYVNMMNLYPVLIICPLSVKYGWEQTMKRFFPDVKLKYKYISGHADIKKVDKYDVVVSTYDTFVRQVTKKKYTRIVKGGEKIFHKYFYSEKLDDFASSPFQSMIMDEVHYIKDEKSKRGKAMHKIASNIPNVIGLTGTPIENSPYDVFNIGSILNGEIFNNGWIFKNRYCNPKMDHFGHMQFKGTSNSGELHDVLCNNMMIRYLKEDVLKDLPDKNKIPVLLDVDMKKWNVMLQEMKEKVESGEETPFMQFHKLIEKAYELKKDIVYSFVDDMLEKVNKIFIVCEHTKVIEEYMERYKGQILYINGAVTGSDREKAKKKFINTKKYKILIGNRKATGTGMDGLQECCSTGIMLELPFSAAAIAQTEDRLYRIGVKNAVNWYYPISKGTIEEKVLFIIDSKRSIMDKTIEGKEDSDDEDIFKFLLKEYKMLDKE